MPSTFPTDPLTLERAADQLVRGIRVRLAGEDQTAIVDAALLSVDGSTLDLYLQDPAASGALRKQTLTLSEAQVVQIVAEDGSASPAAVLAGLWGEWILNSARSAPSAALASAHLDSYPHQMAAVYERMLPQPLLRFLLADEPGTGKTIMSGLWLREAQRLGLARRVLVVCPAHLTHKWIADFDRFFGGGMREMTMDTVRQRGLSVPDENLWVVSLDLAARNPAVLDDLHPDNAGWDAVIFDEAHRLTPTAETLHRVGRELSTSVPHALFLTATPHRGDEWYFRELLHLVDPDVFPTTPRPDARRRSRPTVSASSGVGLHPGPLHFLRRMKEELVHVDNHTRLFKEREAHNIKVHLSSAEHGAYEHAQDLVKEFFPPAGRVLAAMVYGKRTASSLHALAETLRRRSTQMGTDDRVTAEIDLDDIDGDDPAGKAVAVRSLNAKGEKKAIKALLADVDKLLASDGFEASKWPELLACFANHAITPASDGQAVMFTEYADTASWLVEKLRGAGFSAEGYSGALSHKERSDIQGRFMTGGFQVIVSTDAGNEGIDLQAAHVLVNWDVPWSLVRLEQRMGRIHRIGQEDKVWLYNLVALGTREGDAHLRLLQRLVDAANELKGQMFDSLNAILERARAATTPSEPQQLMGLFYETPGSFDTDWPSMEEIRAARDAHFQEMRELASAVDTDASDTARRDDRLGRVNPIIVERFLARANDAGLIGCEPAPISDEGFFYLTPGPQGAPLPASLTPNNGGVLVATRADIREQQINAGHARAAEAVMLGPADPALRSLAETLRTRLGCELHQGTVLTDATSQRDYTLFVYECDITEGTNSADRRQQPRTSACSWLIRVDPDSTARAVAWDTLANLAAPDPQAPQQPLGSQQTDTADTCAVTAADSEHTARTERLDTWARQIIAQLRRLPDDLTRSISDRPQRLARRHEITEATQTRIAAVQAAATTTRSEPRRVAWAHITGTAEPAPDPAADDDPDSEEVSMRHVTELLEGGGWRVRDVSRDGRGYDLHAIKAAEQRCVEVKGRKGSASTSGVALTGGELLEAAQLGDDYWLYVVEHCNDGTGRLYGAWPNPAQTFRGRFTDVPTARLAGSELKAALPSRGAPR